MKIFILPLLLISPALAEPQHVSGNLAQSQPATAQDAAPAGDNRRIIHVALTIFEIDLSAAADAKRADALLKAFEQSPARTIPDGNSIFAGLPDLDAALAGATKLTPVSSPSLTVYESQPAAMQIGSSESYLAPGAPGCFTIESVALADGIDVKLQAAINPDGSIHIDPLTIDSHEMTGREDDGKVPQQFGKPIIRTQSVAQSLAVSKGQHAVFSLKRLSSSGRQMGMLVSAVRVNQDK